MALKMIKSVSLGILNIFDFKSPSEQEYDFLWINGEEEFTYFNEELTVKRFTDNDGTNRDVIVYRQRPHALQEELNLKRP